MKDLGLSLDVKTLPTDCFILELNSPSAIRVVEEYVNFLVTWESNPENELLKYLVFRTPSGGFQFFASRREKTKLPKGRKVFLRCTVEAQCFHSKQSYPSHITICGVGRKMIYPKNPLTLMSFLNWYRPELDEIPHFLEPS